MNTMADDRGNPVRALMPPGIKGPHWWDGVMKTLSQLATSKRTGQ